MRAGDRVAAARAEGPEVDPVRTSLPSSRPLALQKVGELHLEGHGPLSAASGIVSVDERVFVVPDDGLHLGCFDRTFARPGAVVPLSPGDPRTGVKIAKPVKPDLESLALVPETFNDAGCPSLLCLGSGSSERRRQGAIVPIEAGRGARFFELGPLYDALSALIPDLNIEGTAVRGDVIRLVHRGNSSRGGNAIIDLDARAFFEAARKQGVVGPETIRGVREVSLGTVETEGGPVPLTFTDVAPAPDGGYLFSACAENTSNPYDDGQILASAVGRIDGAGAVVSIHLLDKKVKVEGVDARVLPDGQLDVRLVTDPDDPARAAEVFRLIDRI